MSFEGINPERLRAIEQADKFGGYSNDGDGFNGRRGGRGRGRILGSGGRGRGGRGQSYGRANGYTNGAPRNFGTDTNSIPVNRPVQTSEAPAQEVVQQAVVNDSSKPGDKKRKREGDFTKEDAELENQQDQEKEAKIAAYKAQRKADKFERKKALKKVTSETMTNGTTLHKTSENVMPEADHDTAKSDKKAQKDSGSKRSSLTVDTNGIVDDKSTKKSKKSKDKSKSKRKRDEESTEETSSGPGKEDKALRKTNKMKKDTSAEGSAKESESGNKIPVNGDIDDKETEVKKNKKDKKDKREKRKKEFVDEDIDGSLSKKSKKVKKEKKEKRKKEADDDAEDLSSKPSKKDKKDKNHKKTKDSTIETNGTPDTSTTKKRKHEVDSTPPTAQQESWNASLLPGDDARKSKFLRLLGGARSGIVQPDVKSTAVGENAEVLAKAQKDLEKQFDDSVRLKAEGKRKGLGAF